MRAVLLLVLLLGGCRSLLGIDDEVALPDAKSMLADGPKNPADSSSSDPRELGDPCNPNDPNACPQSDFCVPLGSDQTSGICTTVCVENGTMTTDAMGNPSSYVPAPTSGTPTCEAVYDYDLGIPACNGVASEMQPPYAPNTSYSYFAVCVVECGPQLGCPTGLRCDEGLKWCIPN